VIEELQRLIDNLPQSKIDAATYDLHFDWSDLSRLSKGQMIVLLKRLRNASHKTIGDYDKQAEQSPLIQHMKKHLSIVRRGLQDGLRRNDSQ
jgi:hypothetical protein